ncbi:Precorrin-2 methyltransferase [Planktothrix serta PCC 8927]|uniref:Precorrin-2 methyltransferase n=1 Tax=Planktothrix serta PCC 8927 TaxID=671068 RepID=A0A7Z9DXP4_9CYAN|nr:precorrin-2 C(20)-methyltransferase [Planktothrix serta]VXD11573.1 Precorrin-2 methyltransferase [Planktothrix serta PCC 8927]
MFNHRSQSLGKLYGIGVGPGDPELITLKGYHLLQRVPIVAFPAGVGDKPGIAEQIITPWLNSDQLKLPLTFPYIQDDALLNQAWQQAAETVWPYLQQGQDVAFVSEGDVSFYSTFTYLAQTLQKLRPEVIVQAIPGICSPLAAVASLGIPLTIRDQKLAILPAIYAIADLETNLHQADVVVLMKLSSVYEQVWDVLQRYNLLEQAYVVERATLPNQVIYAGLSDRPHLHLSYFSILIVKTQP